MGLSHHISLNSRNLPITFTVILKVLLYFVRDLGGLHALDLDAT